MVSTQLACYAPIPQGHRIRLVDLERAGAFLTPATRTSLAIDLVTGVHYIPYVLWPDLREWSAPDQLDRHLANGKWRATAILVAEVQCAAVSIKEDGDINDVCTRLFLRAERREFNQAPAPGQFR